jgi:glycosyltransferase involved in cell wall biosynthesis
VHILHVNTMSSRAGAAQIASRLANGQRARGHVTHLAAGILDVQESGVLRIPGDSIGERWYCRWRAMAQQLHNAGTRRTTLAYLIATIGPPGRFWDWFRGYENLRFPSSYKLLDLPPRRPDILHLNNLHGDYFDLRALPALSRQLPTVVTLHDTWLLSGHCAYSLGCDRWEIGCGHCPDLTIFPPVRRDATAFNWQRKRDIYADSRLFVTTPCKWLMDKVERSMLQSAVVESHIIPYGVDLKVFKPGDRALARQTLGLPQDGFVVLFVAYNARASRFKDYQTIAAAVQSAATCLTDQQVTFVYLGGTGTDVRQGHVSTKFVPYQTDLSAVVRYYQAADVYLHAAHADTFPNVVLEALACGTPVIATAVGGISEQVDDGETGYLVPEGDSAAMSDHIVQLCLDPKLRLRMSAAALDVARRRFDLEDMVTAYLDLYSHALDLERQKR